MKLLKRNIRLAVILVTCLLLSLIVFGGIRLGNAGNRWFSNSLNTALRKVRQDVIPGRVYDRHGQLLLGNDQEGKRVYHQDPQVRAATIHLLGTEDNRIKNGVETFMSYLLYAYDDPYLARVSAAISGRKRLGYDLRLSIDSQLSKLIAQHFPAGKRGSVVVMNYRTGELLSMSSFPGVDPMQPESMRNSAQRPFINRAIQWNSAPGSTFKVITLAAALQHLPGVMSRTFTCEGELAGGDITITDAGHARHGEIDLERALAVSCNIIYAKLALEIGDENFKKTAQAFGLNDHLMFSDLVVEDSRYPSRNRTQRELAWTGPGQSALSLTPLHMCLVAAGIANDGVIMEPKLLLQAVNQDRVGKAQINPMIYQTALSKLEAGTIAQAMRRAVTNGTASRAAVSGLAICGKTGSAQIDGQADTNAWFIGFIQDKNLPYAISVVVEDAGAGSTVASPLAGKVFEYINRMR